MKKATKKKGPLFLQIVWFTIKNPNPVNCNIEEGEESYFEILRNKNIIAHEIEDNRVTFSINRINFSELGADLEAFFRKKFPSKLMVFTRNNLEFAK